MAVTKIWAIKDSLSRVVDYAANPNKTIFSDLQKVIHYAENESKTADENEKICYVTGVNCNAKTAFNEMISVQKRYNKCTGNVAYHAYQSFKTGEVTPEQCHRIGVELANNMWSTDYQVLVATHFNTGTYHNHFVINSVNMWNGRKFDCNKKAYYKFRALSDELCEKEGLTVIKNPKGKTPRSMFFAEKNGEPTKYNLMRLAIDYAVSISYSPTEFVRVLKKQGYIVNLNPDLKYATIRSVNDKRNTRLYRLGEEYDREHIFRRMKENDVWEVSANYNAFIKITKQKYIQPKRYFFNGSFEKTKKVTGLKALYLYYCYRLGYLPKKKPHKPLSPEMREAIRKLERYSQQITLIYKERLNTLDDVNVFIIMSTEQIKMLNNERKHIYNRLRRCTEENTKAELISKRNDYTAVIRRIRRDVKTAKSIIEDNPKIMQNIRAEQSLQHQRFAVKHKQKVRYYDYYR